MSCIQATSVCKPGVILPGRAQLQPIPCSTYRSSFTLLYKQCMPQLKSRQQSTIVCLFGSKDKSEDGKSPWDAFGKAMGNFGKGQSIEEVLRQQMEKKEYYDGSGSKSPPGGGGGGGGDGFGESEDEGFAGIVDETIQVILATLGIIFFYIYIITGEEMIRLAKDYLKYLFGGGKSVRLKNAMYVTGRLFQRVQRKKVVPPENWLEEAIIRTPTWYDTPEKYIQPRRFSMESQEGSQQPWSSMEEDSQQPWSSMEEDSQPQWSYRESQEDED